MMENMDEKPTQIQFESGKPPAYYTEAPIYFRPSFRARSAVVLGGMVTVAGALCIVLNIVGIVIGVAHSYEGYAIWVGVMAIVTGGLTIAAGKKSTYGLIVGSMVMAIVTVIFATGIISTAALGIVSEVVEHEGDYNYGESQVNKIGVGSLLLTMGILCWCFLLAISIIGCGNACCSKADNVYPTLEAQPVVIEPISYVADNYLVTSDTEPITTKE